MCLMRFETRLCFLIDVHTHTHTLRDTLIDERSESSCFELLRRRDEALRRSDSGVRLDAFTSKNCVVAPSYRLLVATTLFGTSKSCSLAPRRPDSMALRPSFRPETSRRTDVYKRERTYIIASRRPNAYVPPRKRASIDTNARVLDLKVSVFRSKTRLFD